MNTISGIKVRMKARLILGILLVLSSAVAPAMAHEQGDQQEAIRVFVNGDSSVEVLESEVYNLSKEAQATEFNKIANNKTERQQRLSEFTKRMKSTASEMKEKTGRNVTVIGTHISVQKVNENTGIVVYTVQFDNLAELRDGNIYLTSAFATSYEFNHKRLIVVAPEGYEISNVNPKPDRKSDKSAIWNHGQVGSNFKVVFSQPQPTETATPTPTTTTTGPNTSQPIWTSPLFIVGMFSVVIAFVGGLLWLRRV